jgi:hypothetical protein
MKYQTNTQVEQLVVELHRILNVKGGIKRKLTRALNSHLKSVGYNDSGHKSYSVIMAVGYVPEDPTHFTVNDVGLMLAIVSQKTQIDLNGPYPGEDVSQNDMFGLLHVDENMSHFDRRLWVKRLAHVLEYMFVTPEHWYHLEDDAGKAIDMDKTMAFHLNHM